MIWQRICFLINKWAPREAGGHGVYPGETHSSGTCFGMFSTPEHWFLHTFWNPPCSLSALNGPSPPAFQHRNGVPQALLLPGLGHGPSHQQTCCLRTPESPATLNQPSLSVSQHFLGTLRPCKQRPQVPALACTSSRTTRTPAPPTRELIPASELACYRSQRLRHSPGRWATVPPISG